MYHRLIYSCHATREISESDLRDISQSAAARNPGIELTGILLYANRRFIQILEGPGGSIFELLAIICSDERASSLRVESIQQDVERVFDDWGMIVTDATKPGDPIGTEFNDLINLFVTRPGSADMHDELDRRCVNLRSLVMTDPELQPEL